MHALFQGANAVHTLFSSSGGAIKVLIDPHTRIAGKKLDGIVELDVLQAQNAKIVSVQIKLRGIAST
jgi:hypothetical protein